MIILGNIFLAIAALTWLMVCNLLYFTRMPGGDAGVGYAWALIMSIGAFSICLAIVTAIIGWEGGFGWVGASGGQRTMLVVGGLLLILLGNGFLSMGEGLPSAVRPILRLMPAILPPLLLVAAAILLNGKLATVPTVVYKLPIYAGLVVGALVVGILILGRVQRNAAILKDRADFYDSNHQRQLDHVDSTDVMKDGVFLYVYTDANHKMDLREKALAKIKTRPDWQEELTRRLQNDWAPQAFTFLASNEVDNKALFPEAVRQGVLIQARLIREDIRKCRDKYDLYEGRFTWEVDRVIRTVDRFTGMGVDFKPAMQELRKALDERTDFEKPKLPAKYILDNWLKKH